MWSTFPTFTLQSKKGKITLDPREIQSVRKDTSDDPGSCIAFKRGDNIYVLEPRSAVVKALGDWYVQTASAANAQTGDDVVRAMARHALDG